MKNLIKKTPTRRELFVQAYVKEGEWDATPYKTISGHDPEGKPCTIKYYGCHYDAASDDCTPPHGYRVDYDY